MSPQEYLLRKQGRILQQIQRLEERKIANPTLRICMLCHDPLEICDCIYSREKLDCDGNGIGSIQEATEDLQNDLNEIMMQMINGPSQQTILFAEDLSFAPILPPWLREIENV